MIVIRNNIIPFKGFKCVNICGVLFVRKDAVLDDTTYTHEKIHTQQMVEMAIVFFYLWYLVEWLVRLFLSPGKAYRNISFEREAYANEDNAEYPDTRRCYAWFAYLKE